MDNVFDLGLATAYSSPSLVESLALLKYCIRNEFGISWKPSDFSKCKFRVQVETINKEITW